jgi:hypothetical protein
MGLIGRITAGGTRTYAHQDGLGSTRLITSSNGTLSGMMQYSLFESPSTDVPIRARTSSAARQ